MATLLASATSFTLNSLQSSVGAASSSNARESVGVLRVDCAHHVNKKSTKKHNDRRPKKSNPSDKRRGGTKDFGPLPTPPPYYAWDSEDVAPVSYGTTKSFSSDTYTPPTAS